MPDVVHYSALYFTRTLSLPYNVGVMQYVSEHCHPLCTAEVEGSAFFSWKEELADITFLPFLPAS
jgi:hypothetical protein